MQIKIVKVQHLKLVQQGYQESNSQSTTMIQNIFGVNTMRLINGQYKTYTLWVEKYRPTN